MIELLVVIGIIAILASLLLPTLARSKIASLNARCKSNMRQLGIALTLYSDEANAYPYALDWGRKLFWYDQMAPHYASNMNLLGCPAFKGDRDVHAVAMWLAPNFFYYKPGRPGDTVNGVSYGYNGYGLRSTGRTYSDNNEILGMGCSLPEGGGVDAVSPNRLMNPSDMITLADSMYMPVVGAATFSYLLAVGDGSRPSPDRHNGGSNITFADGHVQNILNPRLTADTDAARRRWNNDHEPHLEVILK